MRLFVEFRSKNNHGPLKKVCNISPFSWKLTQTHKIGQQSRQLGTNFTQQEIFPRHRMILINDQISAINKNHIWRMNVIWEDLRRAKLEFLSLRLYAWI